MTPLTMPVDEPTVALPLLLVQVPPPTSVKVVVAPAHTVVLPVMADGKVFTVTTAVAAALPQPLVMV